MKNEKKKEKKEEGGGGGMRSAAWGWGGEEFFFFLSQLVFLATVHKYRSRNGSCSYVAVSYLTSQ